MKGIIKNFTNIFKRYKNPYLSMDKRFIEPDEKSCELENRYNKSLTSDSFSALMQYIKTTAFSKIADTDNAVTTLIDVFTGDDYSDDFFRGFLKYQQDRFPKIIDVKTEDRNKIDITLKDGTRFNITKLSYLYPDIAKSYPELIDRSTRKGDCHTMAVRIAKGISDDTVIATGSIYTLLSRAKYLHSWVEEEKDGETFCHDFTYNISCTQQDYYSLFHVKPYEKITAGEFTADLEPLAKLLYTNEKYSKLYLSSRAEALKIAKTLPDVNDDDLLGNL